MAPTLCSRLKAARRRALELELRQMELRRTNPAWGQMHESIVDHAAIAERKEERAEAERERAREYRSVAAMLELLIREQAIADIRYDHEILIFCSGSSAGRNWKI